ncbi:hypothetical protein EVAR_77954_1 [Eumeta japonica]|uniref:Uncharacterized protein n=1 Tax=Eumeta variegata TaxID=151549 RepID=A0A4C1XQX4_EUMVA|nr:hypothetical protein EVAR_77954_1 [Eumeta japonica]
MTRDFSSVISLPPTLETRNVSRRPFAPIRFATCSSIRYRRVLGDDGCRLGAPHDPLSWSALGGVAYDVRLDISYRAFSARGLHVTAPQASETHAKPFRGVPFSLIFNFTNSPQSGGVRIRVVVIVLHSVDRVCSSRASFRCRPQISTAAFLYRHGGAALVGYLIQKSTTSQVRARRCSESPCIRTI